MASQLKSFQLWLAGFALLCNVEEVLAVPRLPAAALARARMDPEPNLPVAPGTNPKCNFYWDNEGEYPCEVIPPEFGISVETFVKWNPSLTPQCGNFLPGFSYCVSVPPGAEPITTTTTQPPVTRPTATTTTTTTSKGNGVTTPQPIQSNMVTNCNKFHPVKLNEPCSDIISKYGITLQQFTAWNPSAGPNCNSLWADTNACVGIIGGSPATTTTKPTTTSTTSKTTGISTPLPTQSGMVKNCDKFYKVQTDDTCAGIGARHGIAGKKIVEWHSSLTSSCKELWANVNVCVHTVGYKSTTSSQCSSSDKTWGDNKPAALTSIVNWCDGNSSTDGSGGFGTAQSKSGCYNAPFGENKIQFRARNDFGIGTSLSIPKCNEIIKSLVDSCARGGTATHEGWWIEAKVVSGRC